MATAPSIPATISMTTEQYTALSALARLGTGDVIKLESFLKQIEKENGIKRYLLWVQWQEKDQPLPPHTKFPTNWPPKLRQVIQLINRPVSRTDVDDVLQEHATNPLSVMVTPDPAALLGWTSLALYFPGT